VHKKTPNSSQLMHTVAFPPSSTASAVPLWRFLTFTLKGPWIYPAALFFYPQEFSPNWRNIA
jgi:ABC-type polysaccharide/polyol phosphate export permease